MSQSTHAPCAVSLRSCCLRLEGACISLSLVSGIGSSADPGSKRKTHKEIATRDTFYRIESHRFDLRLISTSNRALREQMLQDGAAEIHHGGLMEYLSIVAAACI